MKSLEKAIQALSSGRRRAFVSRVAWLDLERNFQTVFEEVKRQYGERSELGSMFFTTQLEHVKSSDLKISQLNLINQIQLHIGSRFLDVSEFSLSDGQKNLNLLYERGAALWYNQSVTGDVMVFMSPYKSDVLNVVERQIVLARYTCASQVPINDMRDHFSKFFTYCSLTSAHGNHGIFSYAYRLWLRTNDFLFQPLVRGKILSSIYAFLMLLVAVLGAYEGIKWLLGK